MKTYFDNANITKRHFAILGKTSDLFCNDALQLQYLDELLHAHLKKLGYQRVIFYSPKLMLYCMDEESYGHTLSHGGAVMPARPSEHKQKRQIKLGPLSTRIPSSATAPEKKSESKSGSWNLGKMNSKGAIEIMDKYMKEDGIKTALIVMDTDFFITSFREVVGEGGRQLDITKDVQATLSDWNRNRRDKNIVVWIFQESSAADLAERLKGNFIWDRFFCPMFKEKAESRVGTVIDIPAAGSGEIKNLINYHRIMHGMPVDLAFLDAAAQELEKLSRGQGMFPGDDYRKSMMDMAVLSSLIEDMKNTGGVSMENIELRCGKKEHVSAFTKIEELSGMVDFKRYVYELSGNAKASNVQRKAEIVFKDRLMRHPASGGKEAVNLHISLVGNPGTGKSTVAKLMGEVFHELGLLPTGHVVKVTRDDLVAGYIGQTAMKTKERINEAIGGVLFIDEAYTLARGGENDYGQEAIDTILEAMTDRIGEFSVIVAGYPDEIDMLLKKNPGFKSRFSERITIEDYTAKELTDIFTNDAKKNGFQIDGELAAVLEEFMQRYYDGTPKGHGGEWANARTVINLSRKMRDSCRASGGTELGIEHVPHGLKKHLESEASKPTLSATISERQLDLPRADIFKADDEINIPKMEQAVLFIENMTADGSVFYGTGFLITPNGHFITCNHVIENAMEIKARVRTANNDISEDKTYKCELMSASKDLDIALLKLDGSGLPYLTIEGNNLYKYEKGENVCMSGYPFGKRTAQDCSYFAGKIASTIMDQHEYDCINIDMSGKSGNSGSAVLDMKTGNVIGVFRGSITEGEGLVEEINYMRPIKYFWKNFVK